jgi:hypothetical protein
MSIRTPCLPNEGFSVTLAAGGVYDFYCIPHEHAGMVGRIIVGRPGERFPAAGPEATGPEPVPEAALHAFPSVEEIMRRSIVRRTS